MAKALVIVDMLNDFVRENGALPVKGAYGLVQNIGKIRGKAGEYGVLVIYANDAHKPDDKEFQAWPRHAVAGEQGAEVIAELSPGERELIFRKQDLSFFTNPKADAMLKARGIDELYLSGVATEYCVRQAAFDARKLGYKVNLVVDAIAGVDLVPGNQFRALVEMGNAGVNPLTTQQALEQIVQTYRR